MLGRMPADALFAVGGVVLRTLALRPLGVLADGSARTVAFREARSRREAWRSWEEATHRLPGAHRALPLPVPARPGALPRGVVEVVADRTAALAASAAGGTFALRGGPPRALGLVAAGVPRAAKSGREGFAVQLGVDIAGQGGLVLDPEALRRLDRVDTVVIDAAVLLTGRQVVEHVVPARGDADLSRLFRRATSILEARKGRGPAGHRRWALHRPGDIRPRVPAELLGAARAAAPGAQVLALLRGEELAGVVAVVDELQPAARGVVAAASSAGTVYLAGRRRAVAGRLPAAGVLAGGSGLAGSVHALQEQGHCVLVVSETGRAALRAADVGIGVGSGVVPVAWSADVLCARLGDAGTLLAAAAAARAVSRRSAELTVAASSVGALLAALGPAAGASGRASLPVDAAALTAVILGSWIGTRPARTVIAAAQARTPWHALPRQAVLGRLASSRSGLTEDERARRAGLQPVDVANAEVGVAQASAEELANPLSAALGVGAGSPQRWDRSQTPP